MIRHRPSLIVYNDLNHPITLANYVTKKYIRWERTREVTSNDNFHTFTRIIITLIIRHRIHQCFHARNYLFISSSHSTVRFSSSNFFTNYIKREQIHEMKHEWTVTPNWFSYQSKTTDRTVITYRMCMMSAGLFM